MCGKGDCYVEGGSERLAAGKLYFLAAEEEEERREEKADEREGRLVGFRVSSSSHTGEESKSAR